MQTINFLLKKSTKNIALHFTDNLSTHDTNNMSWGAGRGKPPHME